MKKTEIHGKIENKFIIKNKINELLVMENIQKPGYLSFINKPAMFNTKEDAEKYLSKFVLPEDEKENIVIEESTDNITFFGGILVEFDDE